MRVAFLAFSLVAAIIALGCSDTASPTPEPGSAGPAPATVTGVPEEPLTTPVPLSTRVQEQATGAGTPSEISSMVTPPPAPSKPTLAAPTNTPVPTLVPAPTPAPAPTATLAPIPTPVPLLAATATPEQPSGPAPATLTPSPTLRATPTVKPTATPPPRVLPRTGNRVNDGNVDLLEWGHPLVAERMARIPWIGDGIRMEEEAGYTALLALAFKITDKALVDRILDMPFLRSLESEDLRVMKLLRNSGEGPGSHLMNILDHPTIREEGITDRQLPRVIPLNEWDLRSPELVDFMLNPARTHLDSKTIATDMGTQVDLHIIREPQYLATGMMDHLALSVNRVEQMMDLPLPEGQVILTVADILREGFGGRHYDDFIAVAPHRVEGPSLDRIIAHEVAHIYWTDSRRWVNEGMAQVMEHMVVSEARGQAFAPVGYPCTFYTNLKELERARPEKGQPEFYCNYRLGERLFRSLRLALGDQEFLEAAKRFYLMLIQEEGPQLLDRAKQAFGHPDIIDGWYQGGGQLSPEPLDDSEPTLEFSELGTRILFAGITVESEWQPGGTIPETFGFSAADPPEKLYLAVYHRGENRATEDVYVDYILEVSYEDGFVFERRDRYFRTWEGSRNSRSRSTIGRNVEQWKPGIHTATVYDLEGVKIVEVSWTVTP